MGHVSCRVMLFDLDGTLIDSRADLARSINLMLGDLGRPPLDESRIASFVGDGVRVLVHRSLTATDPSGEPPAEALHARGLELMRKHYAREMLVSTRLFPHVPETLARFGNKSIGLVTSKETHFAEAILKHFGISRYFDCIVGGDTVTRHKPDPAPVLEATRRLAGSPVDAVMVGDSENDIYAGRAAGARTCGVTYGFRSRAQLRDAGPDILIDRFDKLTEFFG